MVLALAIGVWLYDTSENYNKQNIDLNAAMLGAMGLTNKKAPAIINRRLQNTSPAKLVGSQWFGKLANCIIKSVFFF